MSFYRLLIAKILCKVKRSIEPLNDYYRSCGIRIGSGCLICSDISRNQGYLISIGDNVTIASDVTILTHDYSIHNVLGHSTLYGEVKIGNNCFIGAKSIIIPGCSIADNIIVAAGSVVTKSFKENNIVIAGNPAKKISTWDEYKEKYQENGIRWSGTEEDLKEQIMKNKEKLIKK